MGNGNCNCSENKKVKELLLNSDLYNLNSRQVSGTDLKLNESKNYTYIEKDLSFNNFLGEKKTDKVIKAHIDYKEKMDLNKLF